MGIGAGTGIHQIDSIRFKCRAKTTERVPRIMIETEANPGGAEWTPRWTKWVSDSAIGVGQTLSWSPAPIFKASMRVHRGLRSWGQQSSLSQYCVTLVSIKRLP
jgi:hypothetical protein